MNVERFIGVDIVKANEPVSTFSATKESAKVIV